MRRRKDSGDEDHFDLLPFISILLCTLGCLLFVTLAIAALNLGASSDIWNPKDIANLKKLPVLVEWDGATATVQLETGNVLIPCTWESDGYTAANTGVSQLIDLMTARSANQYALFAVRPSGFATFGIVEHQFHDKHLDIGYEPEAQNKKVTLGLRRAGTGASASQTEKQP